MKNLSGKLAILGGTPVLPSEPPFRSVFTEDVSKPILEGLLSAPLSSSLGGAKVEQFEKEFGAWVGVPYAVAFNSCTSALLATLHALELGPGQEVAVTCLSFIASASVILHSGATPVFVDIDPATLSMSLPDLEAKLTPRTRAVIAVHLFGIPVNLVGLRSLCDRYRLLLIEDCAQALGTTVNDRSVGAWGHAGCFSFHANKVLQTGEGGMAVTGDEVLAEKLREIRSNGMSPFGAVRIGYNFMMTNIQAILGLWQLPKLRSFLKVRDHNVEIITNAIREYSTVISGERSGVKIGRAWLGFLLPHSFASCHEKVIRALAAEGVRVPGRYELLFEHPYLQPYRNSCPNAQMTVPRLLSVNPTHCMVAEDVRQVALALRKVLSQLPVLESAEID